MSTQQHNPSASDGSTRLRAGSLGPHSSIEGSSSKTGVQSSLQQQRLNEFIQSASPSPSPLFLDSRTSIDAAAQTAQQTIREFDAAFEWGLPYTTESSWEIGPSVPLERARGSSVIAPARENEMDMRKDGVMDPTTIPGEVSSPELEKRSQSEHISEDAEILSQSSSQPKENASISKRKSPSDGLAPRAETAFGAVELGAATAGLLLFASKFWQSTSLETKQLPQTFSSDGFTYLYYTVIIPYLEVALEMLAGPSFSIGVKHKKDERIVQIVADKTVPQETQTELKESLSELLPEGYRNLTTLSFAQGRIIRAGGVGGTQHHSPKNPYRYASVEMGDSIGSNSSADIATAGPRIQLGKEWFWVHCYHFLDDHYKSVQSIKYQKQPLITHPAQYDIKNFCKHHGGSAPVAVKEELTGQIVFHSGGLSATRKRKNGLSCLVDYAICAPLDGLKPKPNVMRMVNKESRFVTDTCEIRPEGLVYSVGRSSGVQIGRVRKEMSYVKGTWSDIESTKTYEWTVDWTGEGQTKEEWNLGGLGIDGDSGAGVIDMESNSLCGQVWGTQGVQRVAYITAWDEIVDDIEEKHEQIDGQRLRATLPQPDSTSTCHLGQPLCHSCAIERELYLESIDHRLWTIQQALPEVMCSSHIIGAQESESENFFILSESEAKNIDSMQVLKSSKRCKMGLELGPTRSSITPQEEALYIVSEVVKDLPSFLTHGQQWHSDKLDMGRKFRAMSEANAKPPMVAV